MKKKKCVNLVSYLSDNAKLLIIEAKKNLTLTIFKS